MGAIFSIRGLAIISVLSFLAGTLAGGYGVWRLWSVANLQANLRKYEEDADRMRKVLALSEKINDTDFRIEQSNQEILDAINTRIAAKQPVELVIGPVAAGNRAVDPGAGVCIDADGMHSIGQLR